MKNGILRNELFVCDHFESSAYDEKDIMGFSVGHPSGTGLVNYLRYHAFPDENIGNMRTYMVRDEKPSFPEGIVRDPKLYRSVRLVSMPVKLDSHVRLTSRRLPRYWKQPFHFSNRIDLMKYYCI